MAVGPYWSYIAPVEGTALNDNPSYERGTAGAAAIQGAALGSAANEQQFGAWSLSVAPTSNGTSGAYLGTFAASNGSTYTYSAYVQGVNNVSYMLAVADTSNALLGSILFTGGGTWQRYSGTYTEASGANRRIIVRKNGDTTTGTCYVDGWNVCPGPNLQTYLDGDQEGCIWLGAPHASQSNRSGQSRAGGSVIPLASIGFTVDESLGIGMPQVENSSQSYAIVPGAEFQRQRARERTITLTSYLVGTSWGDLHQKRKAAINTFNMDAFTPQQPTRFLYTGGLGTVQIDAIYDGGMEFGKPDGFEETVSVRFVAYQPYWTATTDEGTALAPRVNLGSTNWIAQRNPLGGWGTLGANGSTVDSTVDALCYSNGTLYLGGRFGSAGGTKSGGLAFYTPANNRFGTLGGTVEGANGVRVVTVDAAGTVYFGGPFTNISGLSNTRFIARWDAAGGFGTLVGGTVNATAEAMGWTGGTLVIGGNFTAVAGSSTGHIVLWTRAGYGTTTNGTFSGEVFAVATGLDRRIFAVGQGAITVGGTSANSIGQWANGTWGTMGVGLSPLGGGLGGQALSIGPNGLLYIGGGFGSAGNGSVESTTQWNGVQFSPMAGGLGQLGAGDINVYSLFASSNGNVLAVGDFTNTGSRKLPSGIAEWNGYVWLPLSLSPASATQIIQAPDSSLFLAGLGAGTTTAAAVGTIVNTGMSEAYPTLVARNTSTGTVRFYEFSNTLTGDRIFFDLITDPGEVITLDLTPGARSFTSSFQGSIFGAILGGSNIATWRLLPGTNWVSFFADSDNVATSLYWRPRHESGDGGTIY